MMQLPSPPPSTETLDCEDLKDQQDHLVTDSQLHSTIIPTPTEHLDFKGLKSQSPPYSQLPSPMSSNSDHQAFAPQKTQSQPWWMYQALTAFYHAYSLAKAQAPVLLEFEDDIVWSVPMDDIHRVNPGDDRIREVLNEVHVNHESMRIGLGGRDVHNNIWIRLTAPMLPIGTLTPIPATVAVIFIMKPDTLPQHNAIDFIKGSRIHWQQAVSYIAQLRQRNHFAPTQFYPTLSLNGASLAAYNANGGITPYVSPVIPLSDAQEAGNVGKISEREQQPQNRETSDSAMLKKSDEDGATSSSDKGDKSKNTKGKEKQAQASETVDYPAMMSTTDGGASQIEATPSASGEDVYMFEQASEEE